jgi:hypothetical protein
MWDVTGEAVSADLLMICLSGDRFDEEYLRGAAGALAEHKELGFVAPRVRGGAADVDLALAVWPVLYKTSLTRCVMRTRPGVALADLFDQRTGAYAEIAYLWSLEDRGLAGLQWPTRGAWLAPCDLVLEDGAIFQSMLLRNRSAERMYFQSRFWGQCMGATSRSLPPTAMDWLRQKVGRLARRCGRR